MIHKNSEIIKAWLDGEECEYWSQSFDEWQPITSLCPFLIEVKVRIKPEPKPDIVDYLFVSNKSDQDLVKLNWVKFDTANLRLIWDGETLELIDAEVLK
jgi:hypothetical protein